MGRSHLNFQRIQGILEFQCKILFGMPSNRKIPEINLIFKDLIKNFVLLKFKYRFEKVLKEF